MEFKDKQSLLDLLAQVKRGKNFGYRPNSWEWVEDVRNNMQTDTENYPWRQACEELWSAVSHFQDDEYLKIERSDISGHCPIESLGYWLDIPRYPPLEVLVSIAEAFEIYMVAGGELTLEDVFFGPTKKGVGNYAARKKKSDIYSEFEVFVTLERKKANNKEKKELNLDEIATEYLAYPGNPLFAKESGIEPDYENSPDPEHFLRGYRRWKQSGKPFSNKLNAIDADK